MWQVSRAKGQVEGPGVIWEFFTFCPVDKYISGRGLYNIHIFCRWVGRMYILHIVLNILHGAVWFNLGISACLINMVEITVIISSAWEYAVTVFGCHPMQSLSYKIMPHLDFLACTLLDRVTVSSVSQVLYTV